jgi:hypothetical protein
VRRTRPGSSVSSLATRPSQLAPRNSSLATRPSQLVPRNSPLATRPSATGARNTTTDGRQERIKPARRRCALSVGVCIRCSPALPQTSTRPAAAFRPSPPATPCNASYPLASKSVVVLLPPPKQARAGQQRFTPRPSPLPDGRGSDGASNKKGRPGSRRTLPFPGWRPSPPPCSSHLSVFTLSSHKMSVSPRTRPASVTADCTARASSHPP